MDIFRRFRRDPEDHDSLGAALVQTMIGYVPEAAVLLIQ